MIKIVVADNQNLFRNMLTYILKQEPELYVIGSVNNKTKLLELCKKEHPNILFLDFELISQNKKDTIKYIKSTCSNTKIIVLNNSNYTYDFYYDYINYIDAFILKETKPELLLNIIKCVHEGLFVMNSNIKKYMDHQIIESQKEMIRFQNISQQVKLNNVDIEIIKLICSGYNNSEIASQLNYSVGTVKNRISKILDTTNLKDRTQLAIWALKSGLLH